MKQVVIDEWQMDFYKNRYFGDFTHPVKAASRRAYRDFNRTLSKESGIGKKELEIFRTELRDEVDGIFEREVGKILGIKGLSQDVYDARHFELCTEICSLYQKSKHQNLTYGQAQKWLNMTMKYCYMLEKERFEQITDFLHIPCDSFILDRIKKELSIEKPYGTWSKWDNYDEYLNYQKEVRSKITATTPFFWEIEHWLKEAKERAK